MSAPTPVLNLHQGFVTRVGTLVSDSNVRGALSIQKVHPCCVCIWRSVFKFVFLMHLSVWMEIQA